jgi:hypothetical protein
MAGGPVLPGETIAAYDGLVRALQQASEDANVGFVEWIELPSGCFRVDAADNDVVSLDIVIHLAHWRAGNGTVSILVNGREHIRRSTREIIKSTVHVSYFGIKNNTASHLHSIHFDYDGEQDNHPVFHAQLCNDTVDIGPESAEKLGFEYKLAHSKAVCFKRSRIPTSDMTLPSVLLCLAADHLEAQFFNDFVELVKTFQDKMPLPTFDSTKASIAGKPNHLRSSHWFAHMG